MMPDLAETVCEPAPETLPGEPARNRRLEPVATVQTYQATEALVDKQKGGEPGPVFTQSNPRDLRRKRALDALLILVASPILIPLAVLIALLIRSVSAGPALFRQERVGYRGRRFRCFKFRTMLVDAETTTHQDYLRQLMDSNVPMEKMDSRGDPRIVPFGVFLRASGLDELPQLINVLRGEMSLVGPRPCLPYEYDGYLPWQKERFQTLPGLTGLWQVNGKNRTTFLEMIQLDITYARSESLRLDLIIILKTIPALMVQMSGSRKRRKTEAAMGNSSAEHPPFCAGADRTSNARPPGSPAPAPQHRGILL